MSEIDGDAAERSSTTVEGPLGLLAELTYRCPLACAYCSNPIELAAYRDELDTAEWQRVITEAAELGALQCHLSGGEPLLRRDLADLVRTAAEQGLYTNLVTSALGFTAKRAAELHDAGLDHVQVSLQADEPALSDRIAGLPSFARKIDAARRVRELGWPLTLNVVLHRQNIDRIPEILAAAEELEADRIELANTQYYGWAALNRAALLPSREQLAEAEVVVREAKERLRGRMEIIYVIPDYYATYPKPCMGGWGARQLVVVPTGDALPCLAAHGLPLPSANVREHDLAWIWRDSPMFSAYRGTDWMQDPCRSCDRREVDLGGCRCQAFALTGDATRTDPVCHLSPDHGIVEAAVAEANEERTPVDLPLVPRRERQRN
ncbi:pyrroloquinoline quinone biosynthesis protein PqqE [Actinomycetospora termitidis]|uniref:PqqA peptide cyclase n=1 Tax=Actinomycetospora termitidis TaxID=3053470 RepID=A0ABT7M7I4_9PSEU|nr:pyrroloquinoline quinone biosynthesis protein PqqE [Actinomycetospora sp. Odt1-22]MDL5156638.1 pyrroloquinoline quinone biosynthesis protein PqqE [Actinomycetospora sp. Odt1-22]